MSDLGDEWLSIFNATQNIETPNEVGVTIDADSYFKTFESYLGSEFAAYIGSETSPPCNPGVKWLIAKNSRKITANQVNY